MGKLTATWCRALVEAKLRGTNAAGTTLLRTDPLARACAERARQGVTDQTDADGGNTDGDTDTHTDTPGDPLDVNQKLAQLVRDMQSPETMGVPERPSPDRAQPDAANVAVAVGKLSLSKGPADVPALYDFHNLQIAFDHVWEDARAELAIEAAKTLYRKIDDAGGDAAGALADSQPIKALAREGQIAKVAPGANLSDDDGDFWRPGGDLGVSINDPTPDPFYGGGGGGGDGSDEGGGRPTLPDGSRPTDGPTESAHGFAGVGGTQYPGTIFAAGTVNFGLLVTYRQRWEPITYQAGRLAKTITLAPKETVSYSTRQVVKRSMSRKQMEANQQMRKEDADDTQRDEAEIVARAEVKTNFSLSATGSFDYKIGSGSVTTNIGRDAASSSQNTKKSFREAVRKSAQEYRDERKIEVESGDSTEIETTEKREISNPNDELTVTYLFYELQRRYRVFERLHRIMPVALVAQPVPAAVLITETWLLRYDWIVRRFLLDDSFLPTLDYIATGILGDRGALANSQTNLIRMQAAVDVAAADLARLRSVDEWNRRYKELKKLIGSGIDNDTDRANYKEARDRWDSDVRDAYTRWEGEIRAQKDAIEAHGALNAELQNHERQITRVLDHIRENILYYMQGIWSYEHGDARLLRLHAVEAPVLPAVEHDEQYTLEAMPADAEWPLGMTPIAGKKLYKVTVTIRVNADLTAEGATASLAELVDLDRPLGFKCNYMIFPLRESNALTDFMMAPYLDAELGLRDPDAMGNLTLVEFERYIECLKTQEGFDYAAVKDELERQLKQLLMDPLRDGEEIVVPTDSLYIEALVGAHPLIEDFKLRHRALDVMKVKAEVRQVELENLRKAARLAAGERDDPDIDRKIVIEGAASVVVPTDL